MGITCPYDDGILTYTGQFPTFQCLTCKKKFRLEEEKDDRHQEALEFYKKEAIERGVIM